MPNIKVVFEKKVRIFERNLIRVNFNFRKKNFFSDKFLARKKTYSFDKQRVRTLLGHRSGTFSMNLNPYRNYSKIVQNAPRM